MNNLFCPHCRSGYDPVLKDSTWSCGVRFNDTQWRTKKCYKRNLELANERIKRLEKLGRELYETVGCGCGMSGPCRSCRDATDKWDEYKEAKP
jgi:hypothetical protein